MTGVAAAGGAGGSASRKGCAVIGAKSDQGTRWKRSRAASGFSTLTWGNAEHATDDRDECSHANPAGDPRGGRLVSRPRPFSRRRRGTARRGFRGDRPVGARLARGAERGRRETGRTDRGRADR